MKTAALFLLFCTTGLLLAGCVQPSATTTPTPSPTIVPTPKITPTPTPLPTPTPKACASASDCKLVTAQVARYCNGTDNNVWSTETRFSCVQGKCSDTEYTTLNVLLENCTNGCTNGFCNQPTPTPTGTPTPSAEQLQRTRLTRLAVNLGNAATAIIGRNVTLQGSPDTGYSAISNLPPSFTITLNQYAYNTYSPPWTTGYNSYNLTSGNLSKDTDFLQDPGNCRQGVPTCRQKMRMQCYGFSIMATIETIEDTSSTAPQNVGLKIAQAFLPNCPNEFNSP